MKELPESRRQFLRSACLTTGAVLLTSGGVVAEFGASPQTKESPADAESGSADNVAPLSATRSKFSHFNRDPARRTGVLVRRLRLSSASL
jgi:hypothetical protein